MQWSEEDQEQLWRCWTAHDHQDDVKRCHLLATRAVELVAARGGTMTAERLVDVREPLRHHIAAQGAQNAVLEAELALARKGFDAGSPAEATIKTLEAEAARARQSESVWRKRMEAAAVALGAYGAGEVGRLDIAARARIITEQVEAIRRRSLEAGNIERLIAEHGLPAAMRWVVEGMAPTGLGDQHPPTIAELEAILSAPAGAYSVTVQPSGEIRAVKRYPCSPTCTHDDAATPGHPERVKERSALFVGSIVASEAGYEAGAEAMRAACWGAVQERLSLLGIGPEDMVWGDCKYAIEGAAP